MISTIQLCFEARYNTRIYRILICLSALRSDTQTTNFRRFVNNLSILNSQDGVVCLWGIWRVDAWISML